MSDETYDDSTVKSVRLHPPDRAALDQVVENSDEWGNASAAIRGLIREAADHGTVTADGGRPVDDREVYRPDADRLDAVYSAALRLVDDSHVLSDDQCGTVARLVTNDTDTEWSPRADTVRRWLREMQPGFAAVDHQQTSIRYQGDNKGGTIWRIKPETAEPEHWQWHPQNRRERQKRLQRRSVEYQLYCHVDEQPADD